MNDQRAQLQNRDDPPLAGHPGLAEQRRLARAQPDRDRQRTHQRRGHREQRNRDNNIKGTLQRERGPRMTRTPQRNQRDAPDLV